MSNRLNSRDISIIVQGPVHGTSASPPELHITRKALESARRVFPDAEVILSTWAGSEVDGLSFDRVILSPDPGAFVTTPALPERPLNNINRQIRSTLEGLLAASGRFAIKMRTDFFLTDAAFTDHFGAYPHRGREYDYLDERVLSCNLYARNPRIRSRDRICMHPSDLFLFGLRSDLLKIFDRPLVSKEEQNWFADQPERRRLLPKSYEYDSHRPRYCPEQFIWTGFLRKYGEVPLDHIFDCNPAVIEATEHSFASNLVILERSQLRLETSKEIIWKHANPRNCYKFEHWRSLYKAYCLGQKLSYWLFRQNCFLKKCS